jgi:dTDP-4-amino-4,6-dideoxygalactose transaminase
MVDLKTQYHQLKNEIDTAVLDVFESSAFINGKPVQQFCDALAAYLGVKHVVPCANGTDALQIAMMALDLQPGDEVITPSFTYIATTEVVALLRLKPVFVEVDKKTFNIDADALQKAITPRTKAIVPVHSVWSELRYGTDNADRKREQFVCDRRQRTIDRRRLLF